MHIPERLPPDIVDGVEVVRPMRICEVCKEIDDHPRHVVWVAPGTVPVDNELIVQVAAETGLTDEEKKNIIAYLVDTTTDIRHFHCCSEVGCPDGTCDVHPNELKGAELLANIARVAGREV